MLNPLRTLPLLLALSASPAMAAEEGGGLLEINTGLMVWTVLIFVLVLAVLYKLAFPSILGAVEAREAHIRELLAAAARDREEARALLEKQRLELEQARARAQEAFAETRAAAERMRAELVAEARAEQHEALARAEREIQQQVDRAMDELRRDAVDLAIAAATRLVERDFDSDDNRRYVRDSLGELSRDGTSGVAVGV